MDYYDLVNEKDLIRFLVHAKTRSFASDCEPILTDNPGGKERTVSVGEYLYTDRYYGTLQESGQEVVWYRNVPLWSMVYYGGIHPGNEDISKSVFSFLQSALIRVDDNMPFRGQTSFTDGKLHYELNVNGNFSNFQGMEVISFKNNVLCTHNIIGGYIRLRANKSNKIYQS